MRGMRRRVSSVFLGGGVHHNLLGILNIMYRMRIGMVLLVMGNGFEPPGREQAKNSNQQNRRGKTGSLVFWGEKLRSQSKRDLNPDESPLGTLAKHKTQTQSAKRGRHESTGRTMDSTKATGGDPGPVQASRVLRRHRQAHAASLRVICGNGLGRLSQDSKSDDAIDSGSKHPSRRARISVSSIC